jgi:hypothetical protein
MGIIPGGLDAGRILVHRGELQFRNNSAAESASSKKETSRAGAQDSANCFAAKESRSSSDVASGNSALG